LCAVPLYGFIGQVIGLRTLGVYCTRSSDWLIRLCPCTSETSWNARLCTINPPRFVAKFVILFCSVVRCLLTVLTLYWVCVLFSCTVLFVSISQVIGCEDHLRNDLGGVGWGTGALDYSKPKCH